MTSVVEGERVLTIVTLLEKDRVRVSFGTKEPQPKNVKSDQSSIQSAAQYIIIPVHIHSHT